MSSKNINPQDLIPAKYFGIYVPTESDLIFLGRENLQQIMHYWSEQGRILKDRTAKIQPNLWRCHPETPQGLEEHLQKMEARLILESQRAAEYVDCLEALLEKAESKPPFTYFRPQHSAKIGDDMMFLPPVTRIAKTSELTFFNGTVTLFGMHFGTYGVQVTADKPFRDAFIYQNDICIWYDITSPNVLPIAEYSYLKSHRDYLQLWLRYALLDRTDLDSERFMHALIEK